jgi:hypothetical protein
MRSNDRHVVDRVPAAYSIADKRGNRIAVHKKRRELGGL